MSNSINKEFFFALPLIFYQASTKQYTQPCKLWFTNQMAYDENNDETKVKGATGRTCFHFILITLCHSELCWYNQTPVWPHWGEKKDSPLLKILRGDNREWSIQLFFHLLGGLTLLNKSIWMFRKHNYGMYMCFSIRESGSVWNWMHVPGHRRENCGFGNKR